MGAIGTTARRVAAAIAACLIAVGVVFPAAAGAHFADGSAISIRVGETQVTATINLSVGPLREARGTAYADEADFAAYASDVVAYIDEHLTVRGADGRAWPETYGDPARIAVEGVQAFSVEVVFDPGDADPGDFTIDYDAVIEAVDGHETVVVVTEADGRVWNPGILDAGRTSLDIGAGAGSVAVLDMVDYGFDHVLEGADHLLFLMVLLLPAPLVVGGRRWQRGPSPTATLRKVVHVITAFTVGHSLTLMISALGWVSAPARPVETLIAVSVGISAVHAIRPLRAGGEVVIAVGFGLVHGLAFAGILADLGLSGSASLTALFAFNIGIELSQLLTAALVFPSLWLLSTTRWYPAFRITGASVALAAAVGWALERLEVIDNPFDAVEEAAIDHPGRIVVGLFALALLAVAAERGAHPAAPSAAAPDTTASPSPALYSAARTTSAAAVQERRDSERQHVDR